jgi:hypothetical protein
MHNLSKFIVVGSILISCVSLHAEEKKSTVQNVGGLLFEFDEGVEIEKGGGGSVYVKSNREYMEKKFKEIDARFTDLEQRLERIENQFVLSEETETKKVNPERAQVFAS